VGLGLLALAVSAPPPPAQLAVAVTVSGALAAGYVLYAGSSEDGRLTGLGLNPNYLGAALVVPLVTAAGMAWSRRRVSWLLPAAPCLAALLATQSRGAILAVAAGALLVALTMAQPRHRAWILALCAGGAAVMLLGGLGWAQELALDRNNSIRADIAWFALRVISENPLRGIGYGMFPPYAARQVGTYINTHNDYLRLAVEGGPVMLALFVLLLWLGLRHRQAGDLVVVRAAVLAYAVSLVFANTLANLPVTAAFWVALGCLIGRSGKSDRPAAPRAGTGEAAGRC
jgi:O-antigen ligase